MFEYKSEERFISILMKTKHLVHVMVFGVVSSDGNIMNPFIFPHGLILNANTDIKCLEEVVLYWIEREVDGRSYIW